MKKIIILSVSLLLISCSALNKFSKLSVIKREKIIEKEFHELENRFFLLLEDEINEKKRRKLLNDFTKFKNQILEIKVIKKEEHKKFIANYLKLANIKIQYLEDLK